MWCIRPGCVKGVTHLTEGPGPPADILLAAHVHQAVITPDVLLPVGVHWHVHRVAWNVKCLPWKQNISDSKESWQQRRRRAPTCQPGVTEQHKRAHFVALPVLTRLHGDQQAVHTHRGSNGGADVDADRLAVQVPRVDFSRPGLRVGWLVTRLDWEPLWQITLATTKTYIYWEKWHPVDEKVKFRIRCYCCCRCWCNIYIYSSTPETWMQIKRC